MAKERKGSRFPVRARLGPAAAVLLGVSAILAFSAGCATPTYRRATEQDRRLSLHVNSALGVEIGREVEGRAYHGVVALIGKVPTEQGRQRAETLARTVPGVVRINNLILVEEEADSSKAVGSAPVTGVPVIAARAEMVPAP